MSKKKVLLLLAVFLFPIALVFLFQFFSRGVYEVSPLFENGVDTVPPGCPYAYTAVPYTLPDSVMDMFMSGTHSELMLVYFDEGDEKYLQNIARIKDQLQGNSVLIKEVTSTTLQYNLLKRCIFLVSGNDLLVLIDRAGRIRGYYGNSREEMDRLAVEINIILNEE